MEQVCVFVAREKGAGSEILVQEEGGSPRYVLPSLVRAQDEHPCEAAYRLVVGLSGEEVFSAFLKLKAPAGPCHYFLTSPDTPLPDAFEGAHPVSGARRHYIWVADSELLPHLDKQAAHAWEHRLSKT